MSIEKEVVIGEVEKNSREKIVVRFTEFNNLNLIDIRVHAKTRLEEYVPTRKGLTFQIPLLQMLMPILREAEVLISKESMKMEQTQ